MVSDGNTLALHWINDDHFLAPYCKLHSTPGFLKYMKARATTKILYYFKSFVLPFYHFQKSTSCWQKPVLVQFTMVNFKKHCTGSKSKKLLFFCFVFRWYSLLIYVNIVTILCILYQFEKKTEKRNKRKCAATPDILALFHCCKGQLFAYTAFKTACANIWIHSAQFS